jgi:hypothetical protein
MSPALDDALTPDEPPTTKEGWRRFVDYQPQPPAVLTPAKLLALPRRQRAAYDQARRDYHAELPLVNTPTIRQVLNTGRLLIQLNRRQISARRGAIISPQSLREQDTCEAVRRQADRRPARQPLGESGGPARPLGPLRRRARVVYAVSTSGDNCGMRSGGPNRRTVTTVSRRRQKVTRYSSRLP